MDNDSLAMSARHAAHLMATARKEGESYYITDYGAYEGTLTHNVGMANMFDVGLMPCSSLANRMRWPAGAEVTPDHHQLGVLKENEVFYRAAAHRYVWRVGGQLMAHVFEALSPTYERTMDEVRDIIQTRYPLIELLCTKDAIESAMTQLCRARFARKLAWRALPMTDEGGEDDLAVYAHRQGAWISMHEMRGLYLYQKGQPMEGSLQSVRNLVIRLIPLIRHRLLVYLIRRNRHHISLERERFNGQGECWDTRIITDLTVSLYAKETQIYYVNNDPTIIHIKKEQDWIDTRAQKILEAMMDGAAASSETRDLPNTTFTIANREETKSPRSHGKRRRVTEAPVARKRRRKNDEAIAR